MSTVSASIAPRGDDNFDDVAAIVRRNFARAIGKPLFRVTTAPLWPLYLDGFDLADRQVHNCNACRHFVERYGNLVTIGDDGKTTPVMWSDDAPGPYRAAVAALARAVEKAPVEGVFLSSDPEWGTAESFAKSGTEWHHFAVDHPRPFAQPLKTASQAMAEKREEFGMAVRGLAEFPIGVVAQARALLDADALYRSERVRGAADWLYDLHERRAATKNERHRENLTWLAVATAPVGFAHIRSTMIGTLLEDLAAGLPFEDVRRKFADKMHPLQYMRPTAPPSDGNIAEAEKIIATLNTAGALDRRFAKLEDLTTIWTPRAPTKREEAPAGGVFGHLKGSARPAAPTKLDAPASTITWEKFARTVLPTAERMEFAVPHGRGNFIALVTSAKPEAPPILQWDREGARNPVSWYLYNGGAAPCDFNLTGGSFVAVTAITLLPPMWNDPDKAKHHGEGAILVLDGAKDLRHKTGGGFFPESLRSEYHAIRRTIEAHAQRAPIVGRDESSACGYDLRKGSPWSALVRVTSKGMTIDYRLDRWD